MADKAITDLNTIPGSVDDNNTWFAVAQSGTAYKVSGHEFVLALGTILDGHGGVKSIVYTPPVSPSLTGTMVVTLADDSTTTVSIQNGKGISSIAKTGTSGLVDTYTITYNDATTQTFTVTNGAKGDTGDSWYVWIRYAGLMPTSDADIGTTPDDWIGIYSGTEDDPSNLHYTDYDWFDYKGEQGETGAASAITSQTVEYQSGSSGTVVPSGTWTTTIPLVAQGDYLWTRTTLVFNDNTSITSYSVARMGVDGAGSVSSVNNVSPDGNGNVSLDAENVPMSDNISVQTHVANLEDSVGDVSDLSGFSATDLTGAANELMTDVTATDANLRTFVRPNLLDNWYFVGGGSQQGGGQFPINQQGNTTYSGGNSVDRWVLTASNYMTLTVNNDSVRLKKSTNSANPKWVQVFGNDDLVGKTVTLSILYKASYTNDNSIKITIGRSAELVVPRSSSWNCVSVTGTVAKDTWGNVNNAVYVGMYLSSNVVANTDYIDIAAIKLELGSTQTLAHQVNSTWVLNELPNFEEQLLRCGISSYNGLNEYIMGKKIAIFGDSWSDEDIQWSSTVNDVWVKTFRKLCAPYNATINNYSRSSRGWCVKDNNNQYTGREIINNTDLSDTDTVILFLGLNDFLQGIWTSNYGETQDTAKLWGALHSVESTLAGKNVFVVTPGCVSATGSKVPCATLELYRIVLANWAKKNAFMLINGSSFPQIKYNSSAFISDNTHVKNAYQPYIAKYIFDKIVSAGESFSPFIEIANYTPSVAPTNGSFSTCSVKYNLENIELLISGNITEVSSNFNASDLDAPSITKFVPRTLMITNGNTTVMSAYVSDNNTSPKGQLYIVKPSFVTASGSDSFTWAASGYSNVLG